MQSRHDIAGPFNRCTLDTCRGDEHAAADLYALCQAAVDGEIEPGTYLVGPEDGLRYVEIRDNGTYRESMECIRRAAREGI